MLKPSPCLPLIISIVRVSLEERGGIQRSLKSIENSQYSASTQIITKHHEPNLLLSPRHQLRINRLGPLSVALYFTNAIHTANGCSFLIRVLCTLNFLLFRHKLSDNDRVAMNTMLQNTQLQLPSAPSLFDAEEQPNSIKSKPIWPQHRNCADESKAVQSSTCRFLHQRATQ